MRRRLSESVTSRIAAAVARDLLTMYSQRETPLVVRAQLRRDLRLLEPLIAAEAAEASEPMSAEETISRIVTALDEVRARAEYLAGM